MYYKIQTSLRIHFVPVQKKKKLVVKLNNKTRAERNRRKLLIATQVEKGTIIFTEQDVEQRSDPR
jgi:hypothetical protein